MSSPSSDNTTTLIRAVLFVAILALTAGTVIFLKSSNDIPLTPEGIAKRDSIRNIAKPDTSALPDAPAVRQNVWASEEDSIVSDVRTPADAGYEDGYYAGITDGVTGDERASFDESSQFPEAAQRRTYADAYRRGYAQGFADGQEGKSFGVIPYTEEEEEEE